MPIIDLTIKDAVLCAAAAQVLLRGFREGSPEAWPTLEAALDEVRECILLPEGIVRAFVAENGQLLGWIGGRSEYDGHVWELHPLVVDPDFQGQGIGRALVLDFETQVAARGAMTIMLGTDDEVDRTSLGGVDVYPEIWRHIAAITNRKRHPFEFYQKLGFVIYGILPDANGFGKPDILMAKRVGSREGGAPPEA
jgi:aminoglycoside 6'-N-acetyltransferase I